MPMDAFRAANRARWDESVPIHMASDSYGLDDLLAGRPKLPQRDIDELGDVRGKTLLHLQCHFGMDTLSWAMLGARVTGLDFSEAAITTARSLAGRLGIDARFVLSELYDAPSVLDERFDIVYTGVGALNWLPDIAGWARVVAACLQPGGRFYVVEAHPMLATLDDERPDGALVVRYPYFERAEPSRWDDARDYADPGARLEHSVHYEWNHGLGEVVTALIDAGLTLDWVREHRTIYWRALPWLVPAARDGEWRLPDAAADLAPLMYSIRARRGTSPPNPLSI